MPFMGGRRKYRILSDDEVQLTQKGKDAAENDAHSGGRALVLLKMNDRGTISVKELATDTGMSVDRTKDILEILMGKAEVQKVSL